MADPTQAPDPTQYVDVGNPAYGDQSKLDHIRGLINHLSGGGIPAIQQSLQTDFQRRMNEAQLHKQNLVQLSGIMARAHATGTNPMTGNPVTPEEMQAWDHQYEMSKDAYDKIAGQSKDAKPIAQQTWDMLGHLTGKHKRDAEAEAAKTAQTVGKLTGQQAPAAAGQPSVPPPPQLKARPDYAASPAPIPNAAVGQVTPQPIPNAQPGQAAPQPIPNAIVPPPPMAGAGPSTMDEMGLSARNQMMAQQREQSMKEAEQESGAQAQAHGHLAVEHAAPELAQQKIDWVNSLPPEQQMQGALAVGLYPKAFLKPTIKEVPDNPDDPTSPLNHYEAINPYSLMMGGDKVQARPTTGLVPKSRQTSSTYNADTGTTSTASRTGPAGATGAAARAGGGVRTGAGAGAGSGSKAGGRIAVMADDWANNGLVPKQSKDVPQVQQYMAAHGMQAPTPLTQAAQKVMVSTAPVIDQVNQLLGDIDRLKLGDNNSRGYLLKSRLQYMTGSASPEGTLAHDIAGLSLGSIVEAASALQGSSRSLPALKKAMEHTPNAWVDSPMMIKSKLTTIRDRLNDMMKEAQEYGKKAGVSAPPKAGGATAAPAAGPRTAEEYLKSLSHQ